VKEAYFIDFILLFAHDKKMHLLKIISLIIYQLI